MRMHFEHVMCVISFGGSLFVPLNGKKISKKTKRKSGMPNGAADSFH